MVMPVDQTGAYSKNSESKNATTLHMEGATEHVDINTNHAQSRSRYSMTTCMAQRAPWRIPPLGVHFKGKTQRILRGLEVPPGVNISLTHSPSGSYNLESFLEFLDASLPAWTEERA